MARRRATTSTAQPHTRGRVNRRPLGDGRRVRCGLGRRGRSGRGRSGRRPGRASGLPAALRTPLRRQTWHLTMAGWGRSRPPGPRSRGVAIFLRLFRRVPGLGDRYFYSDLRVHRSAREQVPDLLGRPDSGLGTPTSASWNTPPPESPSFDCGIGLSIRGLGPAPSRRADADRATREVRTRGSFSSATGGRAAAHADGCRSGQQVIAKQIQHSGHLDG